DSASGCHASCYPWNVCVAERLDCEETRRQKSNRRKKIDHWTIGPLDLAQLRLL
ncbi:hypothetical protein XENOCAPTIV_002831, partial [Xenoophorus captivus]